MSQAEPHTITVLVVDDHSVVRQGVQVFLETQPGITVVGEAESGADAVQLAIDYAPDVALVDLVMPEMDGIETTRRIKDVSPRTQIVVLTSYHEDEHILPAIRAGALSYLLKDVPAGELVRAVRKAAHGEAVLHPHVAARLVQDLHRQARAAPDRVAELSEREREVLELVADGLSNADIATRLIISEKTVKSHVSNILSKLQLADRTQIAVYAWRVGLMREHQQK